MNTKTQKDILNFPLASGNMYYEVEEEMRLYLDGDCQSGFRLRGGVPSLGEISTVNFAEILLDFALAWNVPGDEEELYRQAKYFGSKIGEFLVNYLEQEMPERLSEMPLQRIDCAVQCILNSMDASFSVETHKNKYIYRFDCCPIIRVALAKGLFFEEEQAHMVLKAVCESCIQKIDPSIKVEFQRGDYAHHVIQVFSPAPD